MLSSVFIEEKTTRQSPCILLDSCQRRERGMYNGSQISNWDFTGS